MPRFKIGDPVRILPDMATPFVNLKGIVHDFKPHERNVTTLDRYVVMFEWGESQPFYDAQLALIEKATRQSV
jgi:hypothetical protein